MKKKLCVAIFAIISAVCCAFSFAACNTPKDDEKEKPEEIAKVEGTAGLEYTLSDDGTYYYFSGLGTCTETEIVIANYYNEKPVKQIGKYTWLTEEEMAEYVADLSDEELVKLQEETLIFEGSKVTSVTISEGITTIGVNVFVTIGDGYYNENIYLKNVSIPDSVTTICGNAFGGCSSLTNIILPDNVTSIGAGAFTYCYGLTSITIHDSVTTIGDGAFGRCSGLTAINFEGTVEQWNAIAKGDDWDMNTGDYTVHCTDGYIAKENG